MTSKKKEIEERENEAFYTGIVVGFVLNVFFVALLKLLVTIILN